MLPVIFSPNFQFFCSFRGNHSDYVTDIAWIDIKNKQIPPSIVINKNKIDINLDEDENNFEGNCRLLGALVSVSTDKTMAFTNINSWNY